MTNPAAQQVIEITPELIASAGHFAEGPRVSDDGTIWFSDLLNAAYYRQRPGHAVEKIVADRQWIGGATFDEDGSLICGGRGGLGKIDLATGHQTDLLTEIGGEPIIAINDVEADRHGGLFGGTIDFVSILEKGEAPQPGKLFYLSNTGDVRVLRDDVLASNGIAFSPDGRFLYHSETSRGVWRYALDADGMPNMPGDLLIELPDSDGLVVDSAGAIWVVRWDAALLCRYLADGTLDQTLSLGFPHLVSLAFGGPDLHDLYVSTGGNAADQERGGVVKIRVEVPGQRDFKTRFSGLGVKTQ